MLRKLSAQNTNYERALNVRGILEAVSLSKTNMKRISMGTNPKLGSPPVQDHSLLVLPGSRSSAPDREPCRSDFEDAAVEEASDVTACSQRATKIGPTKQGRGQSTFHDTDLSVHLSARQGVYLASRSLVQILAFV